MYGLEDIRQLIFRADEIRDDHWTFTIGMLGPFLPNSSI